MPEITKVDVEELRVEMKKAIDNASLDDYISFSIVFTKMPDMKDAVKSVHIMIDKDKSLWSMRDEEEG